LPYAEAVFTGKELFDDVRAALALLPIMYPELLAGLDSSSDYLNLFVLSQLHGCELVIPGEPSGRIVVSNDGSLGAWMEVRVRQDMPWFGFPLFSTKLKAEDHCQPAMLAVEGWHHVPIELASDGKLGLTS
jgi:hypothetical protein